MDKLITQKRRADNTARKKKNEILNHQIEENKRRIEELEQRILSLESFTERDLEIWKFANTILSILGFEQTELSAAVRIESRLREQFDSSLFRKRFLLSDFYARNICFHADPEGAGKKYKLTNKEQTHLSDFIVELVGDKSNIDFKKAKGVIKEQLTALGDFRDITEGETDATARFVFFFAIISLIKRWADFLESSDENIETARQNDEFFHSEVTRHPDEKDLFFALFPIARYPFILFPHQRLLKEGDDGYNENPSGSYQKVFQRLKIKYNSKDLNFSASLNASEKKIVKAFANSIDFPDTSLYYPSWLN